MKTRLKSLFIDISTLRFAVIISILNAVLFHIPFIKFCISQTNIGTFKGLFILTSFFFVLFALNVIITLLLCLISRRLAKILWCIFFIINAISLYFINTFGVILDEPMIGNVLNTNTTEAYSFISTSLVAYTVLLGILPAIYISQVKMPERHYKKTFSHIGILSGSILIVVILNIINFSWITTNIYIIKSSVMPWAYTVNIARYYKHLYQNNKPEVKLPDAKIKDNNKAVVVLVIGESARRENFSIYGYSRNTNPLLSAIPNLHHFNAQSDATFTIAGVKAILDYKPAAKKKYECLTSYLHRTGAYVIWRTTNNGQPKMTTDKYMDADSLAKIPSPFRKNYDEVLLSGLKEEIMAATKDKVLIVLHTGTCHGPIYSMHYPKEFEIYKPVNKSADLEKCNRQDIINAYDNTIVYTDYILNNVINILKEIPGVHSTMMYVSDHGESLGESGFFMHGVDRLVAPKQQYEIPFIIWTSDNYRTIKNLGELSQHYVFHSTLNFLSIESPVYNEELNIFSK